MIGTKPHLYNQNLNWIIFKNRETESLNEIARNILGRF